MKKNILTQPFISQGISPHGYTLIELAIALVITSILAALGLPTVFTLLRGNAVANTADNLEYIVREVQHRARYYKEGCSIIFLEDNANHSTPPIRLSGECSLQLGKISDKVQVSTNLVDSQVSFSFQGIMTSPSTTGEHAMIAIATDNIPEKRCLIMSNLLGVVRQGIYDGSMQETPVESKCRVIETLQF